MNKYNEIINRLTDLGFEQYTETSKEDIRGTIMVAPPGTPYFGECVDVYEDGTYDHYNQFKNEPLWAKI